MAQRWMQAKIELGKSHGFTKSGAGRPMGFVSEDRPLGADKEDTRAPIKVRDIERVGLRIVTVSPVMRKINGTVMVKKPFDKLPKSLQRKLAKHQPA